MFVCVWKSLSWCWSYESEEKHLLSHLHWRSTYFLVLDHPSNGRFILFSLFWAPRPPHTYRLKGEFHSSSLALEAANCHYRLKLIMTKTVPEQVNKGPPWVKLVAKVKNEPVKLLDYKMNRAKIFILIYSDKNFDHISMITHWISHWNDWMSYAINNIPEKHSWT